jgi:prophage antirepressor-like protein
MSNAFKEILTTKFNQHDIKVYGTHNNPLFKANSIGQLLEIINIQDTIYSFDDEQKIEQNGQTFLTEEGLFKLLRPIQTPVADQLNEWTHKFLKQLHFQTLKAQEEESKRLLNQKEQELLEYKGKTFKEVEKKGYLYVLKTDIQNAYKIGKTKDAVAKRIRGLQTGNCNDIDVLFEFPTGNPNLLEYCVHHTLEKYRCNSKREFFDCRFKFITIVIRILGTIIDVLLSSYDNISEEEIWERIERPGMQTQQELPPPPEYDFSHDEDYKTSFFQWLDVNIEYKADKSFFLQTRDVLKHYLDKETIHSSESTAYRQLIEQWIKSRFPEEISCYSSFKIGKRNRKGWRHFCVK